MYSMKNKTKRRKTKTRRRIKRNTRRMVGGAVSQVSIVLKTSGKPWIGVDIVPANTKYSDTRLFRFTYNEKDKQWYQGDTFWFGPDDSKDEIYPYGYVIDGQANATLTDIKKGIFNSRIVSFTPEVLKANVLSKLNMLGKKEAIGIIVRPIDQYVNNRIEDEL